MVWQRIWILYRNVLFSYFLIGTRNIFPFLDTLSLSATPGKHIVLEPAFLRMYIKCVWPCIQNIAFWNGVRVTSSSFWNVSRDFLKNVFQCVFSAHNNAIKPILCWAQIFRKSHANTLVNYALVMLDQVRQWYYISLKNGFFHPWGRVATRIMKSFKMKLHFCCTEKKTLPHKMVIHKPLTTLAYFIRVYFFYVNNRPPLYFCWTVAVCIR